jgi:ribonuclease E
MAEQPASAGRTGRGPARRWRPSREPPAPPAPKTAEGQPRLSAASEAAPGRADAELLPERIDFEQAEIEAGPAPGFVEPEVEVEGEKPDRRTSPRVVKPSERSGTEKREMLINVSDGDECRIAMLCDGRLEELFMERATATSNVGNIYKGRVTNVEPSIQAAFVDFGLPLHGFLHISDLHPKYFPESKGEAEVVGKKTPRRHRPPIQVCLRRGQEIVVQVIKEGIGTKGPTLSSYISLPGRFLVMMPDMEQLGVSRKIEDEEQRRLLRDLLAQLSLPKDMGFIVRTAGLDRTKRDLQRDLNYLTRLWRTVVGRLKKEPAPAELYKESDLVIRTIRDVYDSSLSRIVVDSSTVAAKVRDFLSIASPRSQDAVVEYTDAEPLFHRHGIESEIDKLHSRHVPLPCGGSLVIEQTEALVAIDVNSGRFRVPENAEETAYRVNLEAVDEIARQLRLRDLGGLIICDLIDMAQEKHRRAIERRLADALKKHKERAKILRISRFGILEMTRQRQRPSFAKSVFQECARCGGSGRVKTPESAGLDVMRQIRLASHRSGVTSIDVSVSSLVATDLLNRKRHQITDLERATGQTIRIHAREDLNVGHVQVSCTDRRGREVPTASADLAVPPGPGGAPDRASRPRDDRRSARPSGPPNRDSNHGNRRRGGRRRGRRGR